MSKSEQIWRYLLANPGQWLRVSQVAAQCGCTPQWANAAIAQGAGFIPGMVHAKYPYQWRGQEFQAWYAYVAEPEALEAWIERHYGHA